MAKGIPDYNVWSTPTRPTPAKGIVVFRKNITVPANTSMETSMGYGHEVVAGTISRVELTIPPGHAGLTGFKFATNTLYSIPKYGWLKGGGERLIFDVDIPVPIEGGIPAIYGTCYNLDDTYDHTFYLRFWVLLDV